MSRGTRAYVRMDVLPEEDGKSYFSPKFCLLLMPEPDKAAFVQATINPLLRCIDHTQQIIQVTVESKYFSYDRNRPRITSSQDKLLKRQGAVIPGISIMLFLSECGQMSYQNMKTILTRPPWKFHHKIELTSKRTPSFNVARQEYYILEEEQPLWSVNPVHCGKEHLRISLFARNFNEMVEFYRIVTEREMESTKPGFCSFDMSSHCGVNVQLTLKYSPNIIPIAMESTLLFFQIKDMRSFYPMYGDKIARINYDTYQMNDPDGNHVVLQEFAVPSNSNTRRVGQQLSTKNNDANSESQDSGRWSNNGTDVSTETETYLNASKPKTGEKVFMHNCQTYTQCTPVHALQSIQQKGIEELWL